VGITARDVRLLRDLTLSHVLARDQLIALGYFNSVTRTNTRIRFLRKLGLLKVLPTPFFNQALYGITAKASEVVGERLAPLAAARADSPRFLQHALCVTNLRITLLNRGAERFLFEQQVSASFTYGGKTYEVRPDGMAIQGGIPLALECDMAHAPAAKIVARLKAYDAFVASGEAKRQWHADDFGLLIVTPSPARARRLAALAQQCRFSVVTKTFLQLGVECPGSWS